MFINTDYGLFIRNHYNNNTGLENKSYDYQMQKRWETLFGKANFHSTAIKKHGHDAWEIIANLGPAQLQWAKEHGVKINKRGPLKMRLRRGVVPWIEYDDKNYLYEILRAQIKLYRPDVIVNFTMDFVNGRFLAELKPYFRLLIGQHAATQLRNSKEWSCYDHIISSFPPTIDWAIKRGLPSTLIRLAFEPEILNHLTENKNEIPISFVGSLFKIHESRLKLLNEVCENFDVQIWGPPINKHCSKAIQNSYKGEAWGIEMYNILYNSKISLNHHGNIAPFANNLRLFESTGVGTLLLTDWKKNLNDIFKLNSEIIAYQDTNDCLNKIQYYLKHDNERLKIASAGQKRVLQDHSYDIRIPELLDVIKHIIKNI